MTEMDCDHCRIVSESLNAERAVDEQTFTSLAILEERLNRLRKLNDSFFNIKFSPHARKLMSRRKTVPVG